MDRLNLPALGDEIRLPITPGEHKLAMNRLGYELFEQSFTVTQGKDVTIRPTWKEIAHVAQPPSAAPTPADKSSAPATSPLSHGERGAEGEGKKPAPQPAPTGTAVRPGPATPPEAPERPEAMAARKRLESLDARFAEALKPVEKLAAARDFRGAAVELDKIRFEEPDLTARLVQRRDELKRMHDLKQKIVAAINAAKTPLKKSALGIKGMGGDVIKADDAGLACKLISGKNETLAWADLGPKAMPKVAQLAVERTSADDWIAAGLLALVGQDPTFAERSFDQARSLGAKIEPYLTPLASAAFARAKALLDKSQFADAETTLAAVEEKNTSTPWFNAHRQAIAAARAAAKTGIHETEAERLYAEAVELFKQKEFFDLKPFVAKLKSDYATTRPVADRERKPPFDELEKATENLGKRITVRQDGKGDFTAIQAAIDAAPPNSLIEIQDNGPFYEKVLIQGDKQGMTVRGGKGFWPIIRSGGPLGTVINLVVVEAPEVSLERLIIMHTDFGGTAWALSAGSSCHARWLLCAGSYGVGFGPRSEIHECLLAQMNALNLQSPVTARNIVALDLGHGFRTTGTEEAKLQDVVVRGQISAECPTEVRRCTIAGSATLSATGVTVVDSIITGEVTGLAREQRIEFCNVSSWKFVEQAKPGKGCLGGDPQFFDPQNLDYRLQPTSPCIGRGSNGGDVGCRYTPEMIELCKQALELRRRGILKF